MNNEDKILELIYLFVDGEASEGEKNLLFDAMSENNELQKELQSAILMNRTSSAEYANSVVPAGLEAKLLEKAGFSNISDAEVLSKDAPAKKESLLSKLTGKFLIPMISAGIGAIITFFLLFNTADDRGEYVSTDFIKAKKVKENKQIHHLMQNFKSEPVKVKTANNKDAYQRIKYITVVQENPVREKLPEPPAETFYLQKVGPAPVNIKTFDKNNINEENVSQALLPGQDVPELIFEPLPGADYWDKLSVQLAGLGNIALFPDRTPDEKLIPGFNNTTFEVNYSLDDNKSIGFSAGRETFPIYVKFDNELDYRAAIDWYGANIKYTGGSIITNNIKPYYQFTGAYTVSGPLFRGSAGLAWQPDHTTKFVIGMDLTTLIYYYKSKVHSGEKIGFKYGIEVDF